MVNLVQVIPGGGVGPLQVDEDALFEGGDVRQQTARQAARAKARQDAREAQRQILADQKDQERRRSALGVKIADALAERDTAIRDAETRAGQALRDLVETEGLTLRDAVAWSGLDLSMREAHRLRRLAPEVQPDPSVATVEIEARTHEEAAGPGMTGA